MVRIFIVICLLFLYKPVFAGEKEELQLQQALLQERLWRLQAEFIIAQTQQREVDAKLKSLEEKEKENVDKKNDSVR